MPRGRRKQGPADNPDRTKSFHPAEHQDAVAGVRVERLAPKPIEVSLLGPWRLVEDSPKLGLKFRHLGWRCGFGSGRLGALAVDLLFDCRGNALQSEEFVG